MQAIQTKYLPATNRRGDRIIAKCHSGKITVPWNWALDTEENHRAAAYALARSLGLFGAWVSGWLADSSYVHTCLKRHRYPHDGTCDRGGRFRQWDVLCDRDYEGRDDAL